MSWIPMNMSRLRNLQASSKEDRAELIYEAWRQPITSNRNVVCKYNEK